MEAAVIASRRPRAPSAPPAPASSLPSPARKRTPRRARRAAPSSAAAASLRVLKPLFSRSSARSASRTRRACARAAPVAVWARMRPCSRNQAARAGGLERRSAPSSPSSVFTNARTSSSSPGASSSRVAITSYSMTPVTRRGGDMAQARHEAIHIDEVPEPTYEKKPGDTDWRPLRIHFGITSFGVNAFTQPEAGEVVVIEHTETEESDTRHEELYFVSKGHAT